MNINLFTTTVYKMPVKLPIKSVRTFWMYMHTPQRMEEFQGFYEGCCARDGYFELQRFILLVRTFSDLNELELVQLFDFFDYFKIQKLDCQSLYLVLDLLLSNALGCRRLFLFSYQTVLISYLQTEQNSQFVLKSRLFQLLFLMNITSTHLYTWGSMVEGCVSQVSIHLAMGFAYMCISSMEGEKDGKGDDGGQARGQTRGQE